MDSPSRFIMEFSSLVSLCNKNFSLVPAINSSLVQAYYRNVTYKGREDRKRN